MKTIKVSEATDTQLDWLVAKCEGLEVEYINDGITRCLLRLTPFTGRYSPTTDWSQMGPIIEREKIDCIADPNGRDVWEGRLYRNKAEYYRYGATALIAAARCYVASELGETVEVPEELT